MSGYDPENPSLSHRFLAAVSDFHDRHEGWFSKHPYVDSALAMAAFGTVVGYNVLRFPDRAIRSIWWWKTTPLESFEPPENEYFKVVAPYWQDLVFGDGRAEKLIKRLEGIPQVKDHVQKICLHNSGGGLRVLPAHRELVKYGLNDNEIGHVMFSLKHRAENYVHHKDTYEQNAGLTIDFDEDVSLIAGATGVYTDSPGKLAIIEQGGSHQYSQMDLTGLIDAYRQSESSDDKVVAIANRISAAVYSWMLEDVLPVVPRLFPASYTPGFGATAQADGSFRLERLPPGADMKDHARDMADFMQSQHPDNRKSLYEVLAEGYTGSIPTYPAAPATPAPAPAP